MAYEKLKQDAYDANVALVQAGLVVLTWGNASAADRSADVMAIKPSGVPYDQLKPEHMVVLKISTGAVVEGSARPSSDTPTHLELYRAFKSAGGIVHTHSLHATSFAQAHLDLPCFGTTHADNFYGAVPVTRQMTAQEIEKDYEANTGKVIVECFQRRQIDPAQVCGVLVASHAPFAWGATAAKAVENAIVLEFSAQMALNSLRLNPNTAPIDQVLLDKHYLRKHGVGAYYGQPK